MLICPKLQRILLVLLRHVAEAICRNLDTIFGHRRDY